MKKSIINKMQYLLILLCVLLIPAKGVSQELQLKLGKWQTIVDGKPEEGGLFYRFNFEESGDVKITKQMGGKDNIIEIKNWTIIDDKINITSKEGDIVREFDGTVLTINGDELIYQNNDYRSVVRPYKNGVAWIHWIMILIVLIGLNELFRRYKWSAILFFIMLPLFLTPMVWAQQDVTHWFKWVKVYSVVFAVIWFLAMRYTNLHKYKWAKLVAALFLAVNIGEAVTQDFSMGYLPNMLNGIAGILNIITLFYGWKLIAPDNSKTKDLIWPGMTIFWIIAYDVWNIVYVYLNFPGSTSAQFMVLMACTLPALFIKKGTWLQARAFTLAAWFMYYFTFPRFTEQAELLVPRSYNLMLIVATLSITLNVIYFFIYLKKCSDSRKLKLGTNTKQSD